MFVRVLVSMLTELDLSKASAGSVQPLLLRVCVCVCVYECVRVLVRVGVLLRVHVRECARLCRHNIRLHLVNISFFFFSFQSYAYLTQKKTLRLKNTARKCRWC